MCWVRSSSRHLTRQRPKIGTPAQTQTTYFRRRAHQELSNTLQRATALPRSILTPNLSLSRDDRHAETDLVDKEIQGIRDRPCHRTLDNDHITSTHRYVRFLSALYLREIEGDFPLASALLRPNQSRGRRIQGTTCGSYAAKNRHAGSNGEQAGLVYPPLHRNASSSRN